MMMQTKLLSLVTGIWVYAVMSSAHGGANEMNFQQMYNDLIENRENISHSERLHKLFEINWEYRMIEYPEYATYVGYPGQNHRWIDNSLESIERRKRELRDPLRVLETIDRSELSEVDQLNYDLFKRNIEIGIEGTRFKSEYLQISQLGGVHQQAAQVISVMSTFTIEDYNDIIERLEGIPVMIDQAITLLGKGLESGITPPRITLRDVPEQVENLIVGDPMENPLMKPFGEFPVTIPEKERKQLVKRAMDAFAENVVPALRKLHIYLAETYIPGARESIALSDLPDGREWYAYKIHRYTTTYMSPEEIHEIGLSEVKRIRRKMEEIIAQVEFEGTFHEFTEFLRTDPQFYFSDAEDLIREYRDISKRADPELIKLFGRLPTLPYGVIPIPSYAEKSQTTAYYEGGSLAAGRPGYFYANTYNLKMRPTWEMEALTLHEAVPGHHLQLSLALELGDLPEFRKHGGYTAYSEGWGLYAESLGEEMGFYENPYSKFGQLTYEMWRAIRLVVDTGIHALGWSRQEAIDLFIENSSKTEHDVVVEIDRYIVWPGQALAYKIGELKIKELRAYAAGALGDAFDIRAFHDELLGNGSLPLDLLEERMKKWVALKKEK
jgi:uncharacterized protein (DUF885 family)